MNPPTRTELEINLYHSLWLKLTGGGTQEQFMNHLQRNLDLPDYIHFEMQDPIQPRWRKWIPIMLEHGYAYRQVMAFFNISKMTVYRHKDDPVSLVSRIPQRDQEIIRQLWEIWKKKLPEFHLLTTSK